MSIEFVDPDVQERYDKLVAEESDLLDQLDSVKNCIEEIEANEDRK
jgi:hypothetical protein